MSRKSGHERQLMATIDEKLFPPAAARHLGLAVSTLAKLRCRGGSPHYYKIGSRVAYGLADLDAWLASRRVRNTVEGDRLPRRQTDAPDAV